jgi:hypothetical protein
MSVVRTTLFFLAVSLPVGTVAAQQASVPLSTLSDEFNDPATLARWQWHHKVEGWPDLTKRVAIEPDREGGVLVLEPATSGWYEDWHAPFLFKEVTGDFDATVRMQITGLSTPLPTRTWSLAGLMVRAPRTVTPATWTRGGENWVFITTGIAARPDQSVIETKTTVASASRLELSPTCSGWIELRTARKGATFTLSSRCPGGVWEERAAFERPDLPATLQVGIAAYTDWDSMQETFGPGGAAQFNPKGIFPGRPDLRVLVDHLRFTPPGR